jgi:hypothetical protein
MTFTPSNYYMSEGDKYFGSMVSCSTGRLRVVHRSPHRHRERLSLLRLHGDVRGLVEILVGEVGGRRLVRDNVGLLLLLLLLAYRVEGARPLPNQALVLTTGEQSKTKRSVFTTMLVVIPKAVHVLIPSCTIANTASVGTKPLLDLPDLAIAHALFQHFAFLARGEVTRPMGHVVLEPVGLLVRFVAVGLGAFERFIHQQ